MKKLFFCVLTIAFSAVLTGCVSFESKPINPTIIGVGRMSYDANSDVYFVPIDSTNYPITKYTIPNRDMRIVSATEDIEPVEGVLVTVYTSPKQDGIQAVKGNLSVEQIEKLYHVNYKDTYCVVGCVFLCMILSIFLGRKDSAKEYYQETT